MFDHRFVFACKFSEFYVGIPSQDFALSVISHANVLLLCALCSQRNLKMKRESGFRECEFAY